MQFPSEWVVRWAWPIIAISLLIGLLFALPLQDLEIDPEIKNQLPPDMPSRRDVRIIEEKFGGSELVMIVLTADDVLATSTLQRVQKIGEELAKVPAVDLVVSPFTLTDIRGEGGMLTPENAIPSIPQSDEERAALRARLQQNELVFGNVLARDFKAVSIIGTLSTQAKDSETMEAVQAVLAAAPGPEPVTVGGMPEVRQRVSEDIRSDVRRFMPVGVAIIVTFLLVTLRQPRGVFIPFSTQILALVVALGLIPLMGWKVQMVTVTLPVILLAVGNDHTVHLVARFQEENVGDHKMTAGQLTAKVVAHLGLPVIAAGTTTVAGFLCLLTHIVIPAAQLGVLAAVGVGFAMVASLTYAPAVLSKLPVPRPIPGMGVPPGPDSGGQWLDKLLHTIAQIVVRHRMAVVVTSLLVALVASAGIPWLKVDTNPINYYPPSAPVATTARLINQHFGGSTEISVMVEGDIQDPAVMRKIDALEAELRSMPQVGYTMSIARVVRTMNRAVSGSAEGYALPETREGIAQLFLLYGMGGDPAAFERMVDFEFQNALVTARVSSLSTEEIKEVVDRAREVGASQGLKMTVGGFGAVFAELVDAIVSGQVSSLVLSFLVVGVLDALCFWSIEAGLWSLVPLVVSVPALFGLMGWSGIELNVVTAMLSSIMIGVGVDYTIHFLWRYREERQGGLEPEVAAVRVLTTAGRGIVFNALSVIVGFSILFLSNFLPVRFFGFLVVVSIAACLLAALVLMPPLIVMLRPRFAEPRSLPGPVTVAAEPSRSET
jgi:hydrophobe/amphiphile efflux-3 (HAE3) family protein